jgi:hypothetical protein
LADEIAALEAAGECAVPTEDELAGLAPDPLAGPPDGEHGWLADLPGPLLDEYLAATAEPIRPEPLPAGLWSRAAGDGGGFAAGGVADDLPPGPVLAGLTTDMHAAGLGRLADDELVGVLRAARRLGSWSASLELSAVGDLMRRRLDEEAAGQVGRAEHADAEIAAALTLTGRAAGGVLDLAMGLARLPRTARALAAGLIDLPRAAVIVDEVAGLGDEHVARVEDQVLARAGGQTTTKLRAATRRAVIAADPLAARRRREQAERGARVERWTEHAGTAALGGRDLPPAGALAADQHLSELASGLRAAGLAGTMDQLRAQVFMALLAGQQVTSLAPPREIRSAAETARATGPVGSGSPASPDIAARGGPGSFRGGARSACDSPSSDCGGPGSADSSGSRSAAGSGSGSGLAVAGMVNLTMPLGTWLGLSQAPGEVPGFGPLDAEDSRSLAQAMAAHSRTRWCLTIIGENGRPIAHGCASRRRGPPPRGPGPPPAGPETPDGSPGPSAGSSGWAEGDSSRRVAGVGLADAAPAGAVWGRALGVGAWMAGVQLQWLESGTCAHRRESASYRPPPSLQHLIRVRQQLCVFPGCGRAARRCDLDHTIPYHLGGRTCECNLAPLCRKHHQAKQTQGWTLDQPEPGIMIWTTPGGRRYITYPYMAYSYITYPAI